MTKICHNCGKNATGRKAKRYKDGKYILCFQCSMKRSRELEYQEKIGRKPMQKIKPQLIADRGHQCEICGSRVNIIAHHKIRMMDGGGNSPENIQLLCKDCHDKEHANGTRW